MQQASLIAQKSHFRKLLKEVLRQIGAEEKQRQSKVVTDYLMNKCERFKNAKHVAVYLAMKQEEIDTIPLVEQFLQQKSNQDQHLYVPYVDMRPSGGDMVFYELKTFEQYTNEMNTNNKYQLKQFNDPTRLRIADESLFDLVIVPGLAFDHTPDSQRSISRLGRGKGYYDRFLNKIPNCHTIGIGFNQQFLPLNDALPHHLPVNDKQDVFLNEFLCEQLIVNNS